VPAIAVRPLQRVATSVLGLASYQSSSRPTVGQSWELSPVAATGKLLSAVLDRRVLFGLGPMAAPALPGDTYFNSGPGHPIRFIRLKKLLTGLYPVRMTPG
jgi:hypothetical protein